MDGKGRWMDNVFIERLWRSVKYECIYLYAIDSGAQARLQIDKLMKHYNQTRPHYTFNGQTLDEVYNESINLQGLAPEQWKIAA